MLTTPLRNPPFAITLLRHHPGPFPCRPAIPPQTVSTSRCSRPPPLFAMTVVPADAPRTRSTRRTRPGAMHSGLPLPFSLPFTIHSSLPLPFATALYTALYTVFHCLQVCLPLSFTALSQLPFTAFYTAECHAKCCPFTAISLLFTTALSLPFTLHFTAFNTVKYCPFTAIALAFSPLFSLPFKLPLHCPFTALYNCILLPFHGHSTALSLSFHPCFTALPSRFLRISVEADGETVTVTRTDSDAGWGQKLELSCMADGSSSRCRHCRSAAPRPLLSVK